MLKLRLHWEEPIIKQQYRKLTFGRPEGKAHKNAQFIDILLQHVHVFCQQVTSYHYKHISHITNVSQTQSRN